jgi:hypothetical protein
VPRLRPLLAALAVGLGVIAVLGIGPWLLHALLGGRPPDLGAAAGLGTMAAGAAYPHLEARMAAAAGDDRRAAYGSTTARLLGAAPGLLLVAILGYVVWVIASNGGWW